MIGYIETRNDNTRKLELFSVKAVPTNKINFFHFETAIGAKKMKKASPRKISPKKASPKESSPKSKKGGKRANYDNGEDGESECNKQQAKRRKKAANTNLPKRGRKAKAKDVGSDSDDFEEPVVKKRAVKSS